jgi:DNA polymerase-1
VFDTIIASFLLHPERRNHNLKDVASDYLAMQMTPIKELIGSGKQEKTMAQVEIKDAGEYACRDADATLQLTHYFQRELETADIIKLFSTLEIPLIDVLADMEMTGIKIDKKHFNRLSKEFDTKLSNLAQKIYDSAGETFNISSPRQIAGILFEKLKLPPVKSGKTGYSTDTFVLEQLSGKHPLPELLLEYRSYEKLKNTYIDSLPKIVHPETGRIHTTFHQFIAATGRLTSRDPNLQNIPVRTPVGKEIRRGFIPGYDGWILLSADYSQIDLRVLAHLSGDKDLINAYKSGGDIHILTASKVFGCEEKDVTDTMRDQAKTINFGIIYGMGASRLARELKIPRKQAQEFIDDYFKAYTGVKEWTDSIIEQARETGYVTTLLNRRRYLPDIHSASVSMRNAAERIAINTPVQGTAADLIKKAMLDIFRRLRGSQFKGKMLLQIHDELIFEVPESELEAVSSLVKEEMENSLILDVPIKVDLKAGPSWADCRPL